ncbi:methylated-DNA--[protein]-cysteine S-methyltransferase [Paludibacterium paludis]|uniref:Methylated-DNA--protein-cysteine methyltransferase n=1 Tax=Paludibacterium paludis TaxID=1225769 RepID=A0A918P6N9_9NEIS|nr:methylated-DNA--[protein]-cysteine S-methyltransferase [Paludibacterium paludis]GGY26743.1 hypothetical protein GCM10011289_32900 [Paludibacterium paludis]
MQEPEKTVWIVRFDSPLGALTACATQEGVCLVEFDERERFAAVFTSLRRWLDGPVVEADHPHLRQARAELAEYFAGERQVFETPLHLPGTAFERAVWQALLTIPHGETATYGALAARLGEPAAGRAVGAANGRNRVAILVPCHRMLGKDGSLTGYGGGLERKRWLLAHESAMRRPRA